MIVHATHWCWCWQLFEVASFSFFTIVWPMWCWSLTGCCEPNCIPRKLFQSEQQKLMRKYGRYCVNNRRSSIIIENNLQVILMSASAMSTKKWNCRDAHRGFKMNSNYWNHICLSLLPACSISLCFPKLKIYRLKFVLNSPKLQLFSLYQFQQGFPLRVDAQLIKPIQRLTR